MINRKRLERAKEFPPMTKGMLLSKIEDYLSFFDHYIREGYTENIKQDSMKIDNGIGIFDDSLLQEYRLTVSHFWPNYFRNESWGKFDPNQLPSREDCHNIMQELEVIRRELEKTMPMPREEDGYV